MKTLFKLTMTFFTCIAAVAAVAIYMDKMGKEKKYIVMNDATNEIL